jgi:hypothetical protein
MQMSVFSADNKSKVCFSACAKTQRRSVQARGKRIHANARSQPDTTLHQHASLNASAVRHELLSHWTEHDLLRFAICIFDINVQYRSTVSVRSSAAFGFLRGSDVLQQWMEPSPSTSGWLLFSGPFTPSCSQHHLVCATRRLPWRSPAISTTAQLVEVSDAVSSILIVDKL